MATWSNLSPFSLMSSSLLVMNNLREGLSSQIKWLQCCEVGSCETTVLIGTLFFFPLS